MEGREIVAISLLEPGILKGRAGVLGQPKTWLESVSHHKSSLRALRMYSLLVLLWNIFRDCPTPTPSRIFSFHACVHCVCVHLCLYVCGNGVMLGKFLRLLPSTSLRQDPYSNIELSEWNSHLQACSGSCLHRGGWNYRRGNIPISFYVGAEELPFSQHLLYSNGKFSWPSVFDLAFKQGFSFLYYKQFTCTVVSSALEWFFKECNLNSLVIWFSFSCFPSVWSKTLSAFSTGFPHVSYWCDIM